MKPEPGAQAREKVLFYLKTRGPQTAAEVARRLEVTPMAVRQHLYALETEGLVDHQDERRKVGRPARHWRATDKAAAFFPDRHAELAAGMIRDARAAFGESGLERLVEERTRRQAQIYGERLRGCGRKLADRVAELAAIRREEGYLAEWSRARDGSFLLVENHCPICAAAQACAGICAGELALFRTVLGDGADVERVEHLLAGARRCAYRIVPRGKTS